MNSRQINEINGGEYRMPELESFCPELPGNLVVTNGARAIAAIISDMLTGKSHLHSGQLNWQFPPLKPSVLQLSSPKTLKNVKEIHRIISMGRDKKIIKTLLLRYSNSFLIPKMQISQGFFLASKAKPFENR
jgi:hypothetical protein